MSRSCACAGCDTGLVGAPREVFSGDGMGNEAACGVRGAGAACEAWMRGLVDDLGAPGIVELLEAGEPPLEAKVST